MQTGREAVSRAALLSLCALCWLWDGLKTLFSQVSLEGAQQLSCEKHKAVQGRNLGWEAESAGGLG